MGEFQVLWSQDARNGSWHGILFETIVARAWTNNATGRTLFWTVLGNRVRNASDIDGAKRSAAELTFTHIPNVAETVREIRATSATDHRKS